ncbi:MAG: hypothetical protein IJE89_06015 [Bacilli bacterium]|nr:hypothetical protein [Bacilli bacterium]
MKIEFHYTYILIALGFILTGYFHNLIIFTSIIIIHEVGHYTIAKLNKLNVEKITIYPYGGLVKMNNLINTSINKELLVAISGIIFQTIYYSIIVLLYNQGIIRDYIFNLFTMYNNSILIFNILPIHPLDGSKILNLLLSKVIPYNKANKLNIIISIITLIIVLYINYYNFNYTTLLIIGVILDNTIKYYKEMKYIFNKFLLERYIYKITYNKTKKINKIGNMYKDKYHIIKENNTYITEKQALSHKFGRKT